jgi:hypothetical protein
VLATRLLEFELGASQRVPAQCAAAAVRIYEKVFVQLAPVIGGAGVHALFARSIMVTKVQVPALARLDPSGDAPQNAAKPLLACFTALSGPDAFAGASNLYGAFFALMTRFIGGALTSQFLGAAWPSVDVTLSKETK